MGLLKKGLATTTSSLIQDAAVANPATKTATTREGGDIALMPEDAESSQTSQLSSQLFAKTGSQGLFNKPMFAPKGLGVLPSGAEEPLSNLTKI